MMSVYNLIEPPDTSSISEDTTVITDCRLSEMLADMFGPITAKNQRKATKGVAEPIEITLELMRTEPVFERKMPDKDGQPDSQMYDQFMYN